MRNLIVWSFCSTSLPRSFSKAGDRGKDESKWDFMKGFFRGDGERGGEAKIGRFEDWTGWGSSAEPILLFGHAISDYRERTILYKPPI